MNAAGHLLIAALVMGLFAILIHIMLTPRTDLSRQCHDQGGAYVADTGAGYAICLRGPR